LVFGIVFFCHFATLQSASVDVTALLKFTGAQLQATMTQIKNNHSHFPQQTLPYNAPGYNPYDTSNAGGWTCGFFASTLWNMYNWTTDNTWAKYAADWTDTLKQVQTNTGTHDVGFMIFYSFGHGYLLTQLEEYKTGTLTAANSLSQRYNREVGCTLSWNSPPGHFHVIIDNMMNLELLWWASQNGGKHEFFDMSVSHSDHMIRDCIKPDGSSYHMIDYDPTNGSVLLQTNTPQGKDGGVWSRGQAWAIYGFTVSYRFSKYARYLDTAQKTADYFISHLPPDFVPYWDFFAPGESRDSSAAAIAASGILELARYVNDTTKRSYYLTNAENILKSLASPAYLADPQKTDAVITHATGSHPDNAGIDVSLIYGDYYFSEALIRYHEWFPTYDTLINQNK